MSDSKVSSLTNGAVTGATILYIIVDEGGTLVSRKTTVDALFGNAPKINNKGQYTADTSATTGATVNITKQISVIQTPTTTLPVGVANQEITLVLDPGQASSVVTVTNGSGTLTAINLVGPGATCTLMYIGAKWYVKSYFLATFA